MKRITRKDIEQWKEPEVEGGFCHISEAVIEFLDLLESKTEELFGYPTTNWTTFNKAFGGARPGELIVLTADSGIGKTTFALNWLLDTAKQDRNTFMISLELNMGLIIRKLSQMIIGKSVKEFSKVDVAGYVEVLKNMPMYYMDVNGPQVPSFIYKCVQYAAFEKHCRFVVIDHLDYFLLSLKNGWSRADVLGETMRYLTGIAHKTKSTIILIVHPSKLDMKGVKNREVGMDELKGSSSIKQEADAVLSLYRPNPENLETVIRFQKIRADGFSQYRYSFIRFDYDPESLTYLEKSGVPEWGDP